MFVSILHIDDKLDIYVSLVHILASKEDNKSGYQEISLAQSTKKIIKNRFFTAELVNWFVLMNDCQKCYHSTGYTMTTATTQLNWCS